MSPKISLESIEQVLELRKQGKSYKEIGYLLGISTSSAYSRRMSKTKRKILSKKYNERNKEQRHEKAVKWRYECRSKVLTHYGGGELACVACGEARLPCLSIDHINGGGHRHRKSTGLHGTYFYSWLINQGYPEGYQTLCMNCQFVKSYENHESRNQWTEIKNL